MQYRRSQTLLTTFLKLHCNTRLTVSEGGVQNFGPKINNITRSISTRFSCVTNVFGLRKNQKFQQWPRIPDGQSRRGYAELPHHIPVALPALSPTMETGTIISWEKHEGDELLEGDLLAEIQTDKATIGFETPEEGFLAKIVLPAGTKDIPVGKLVCVIVSKKEDIAAFKNFKG